METAQSKSSADYRTEALLWAVRSCAAVTSDILARHPQAARLKKTADNLEQLSIDRSLSRLLWQELGEQENICLGTYGSAHIGHERDSAVHYWQRRARLDAFTQRRTATARLPHPWPELIQMRSAAWRQLCAAIGIEMVACAFSGHPLQRVIGMLGPLGSELAGQVVDRLGKSPSPDAFPPGVAKRWCDAYLRVAANVTGERIVSGLGRSLLAAAFRRLEEPGRAAAAELSGGNLAQTLQADQFLEPVIPEELALCGKITSAVLAKGQRP